MYLFKDNSDLRASYVHQKEVAENRARRYLNLMNKYNTRNSQSAGKRAQIETELRNEGGIGYVRQCFKAECQEVSVWVRAIDMLDGVNPEHFAVLVGGQS